MPNIVRGLTILCLLPSLLKRFQGRYRGRDETRREAEDLSQTAAAKIVEALFGKWPKGNVGAWVWKIWQNVANDHVEKSNRHAGEPLSYDVQKLDSMPQSAGRRPTTNPRRGGKGHADLVRALQEILNTSSFRQMADEIGIPMTEMETLLSDMA